MGTLNAVTVCGAATRLSCTCAASVPCVLLRQQTAKQCKRHFTLVLQPGDSGGHGVALRCALQRNGQVQGHEVPSICLQVSQPKQLKQSLNPGGHRPSKQLRHVHICGHAHGAVLLPLLLLGVGWRRLSLHVARDALQPCLAQRLLQTTSRCGQLHTHSASASAHKLWGLCLMRLQIFVGDSFRSVGRPCAAPPPDHRLLWAAAHTSHVTLQLCCSTCCSCCSAAGCVTRLHIEPRSAASFKNVQMPRQQ